MCCPEGVRPRPVMVLNDSGRVERFLSEVSHGVSGQPDPSVALHPPSVGAIVEPCKEGEMIHRTAVAAFLVFCGTLSVLAQSAIRLQFELYQDGALIANPAVSVKSGETGSLALESAGTVTFTPVQNTADSIAVDFEISSGDKEIKPRLVLRADSGSLSWTSATGRTVELRVAWVP